VSSAPTRRLVAVLAHPRADSFCAALFGRVLQTADDLGWTVIVQDLHRDAFDPLLTAEESQAVHRAGPVPARDPLVARYQHEVGSAHAMVVVHPNWWGMPPAVLVGWIDRVLAPGVAYKLDGGAAGTPEPALDLASLVVTTGDTDRDREHLVFGDPLELIWQRCVLPYVGARPAERVHVSPVSSMSSDERLSALEDVETSTRELLVASFPPPG
jgi:NAD(P)H dehydrogenase (quinone)